MRDDRRFCTETLLMDFDHSELLTLKDYIRWGASRFAEAELSFSHGMSSPFDEAAYLVLHTLHLPVDTPDVYFESRLTSVERAAVAAYLRAFDMGDNDAPGFAEWFTSLDPQTQISAAADVIESNRHRGKA